MLALAFGLGVWAENRGEGPGRLAGSGVGTLQRATCLMQREIRLAREGRLYMLLSLDEGKLELKVRGITLRQFPILRWTAISLTGLSTGPHHLTDRQALFRPGRPRRQAGVSASAGAAEGLSVRDMPTAYILWLGPEVSLFILGQPASSFKERASRLATDFLYGLRATAVSVNGLVGGRATVALRIVLPGDEARALFWSLQEGTPFLIGGPACDASGHVKGSVEWPLAVWGGWFRRPY